MGRGPRHATTRLIKKHHTHLAINAISVVEDYEAEINRQSKHILAKQKALPNGRAFAETLG